MIINGLIIAGPIVLFALGGTGVWLRLRRDDRRDPFASYGLTINAAGAEDFTGWEMPPEIASEPPTEILAAPIAPPWAPAAADFPTPPAPPPPVLHHDAYRYAQRFHTGPPDPAAADLPPATVPPPPPVTMLVLLAAALRARHQQAEHAKAEARDTCQRATAVGAAITAAQRARDEARAADAAATSPWEHDTTWFTLPAIDADATAIRDPGDWDAPVSIPAHDIHEMDAGV